MPIVTITDTTKGGFADTAGKATWALAHDASSSDTVANDRIVARWYRS